MNNRGYRRNNRVFVPQRAPAPPKFSPMVNWPERSPFEGGHRGIPPSYTGGAIYLGRSMICEAITVGTTPTIIKSSPQAWPYMFYNPALSRGVTSKTNIASATYSGSGVSTASTQANYIDVAGYEYAHVCFIVTDISAGNVVDILARYYTSNGSWVTSQPLFEGITETDQAGYIMLGPMGIADRLAFYFDNTGAGTITCSIDVILTGGVGAGLTDLNRTVYLGDQNVTTTTGFPLVPNQREVFILGENVEVWGIASSEHTIRVFSL